MDIGVIGVFLSFFLVLFVNDANSTVEKIYGIAMQCKARVLDVAALAKTTLPREYAFRLVRYMNAVVGAITVCELAFLSKMSIPNFFSSLFHSTLLDTLASRESTRTATSLSP